MINTPLSNLENEDNKKLELWYLNEINSIINRDILYFSDYSKLFNFINKDDKNKDLFTRFNFLESDNNNGYVLLFLDKKAIWYLKIKIDKDLCYINYIFIEEKLRNKWYSKMILRYLFNFLKEKEIKTLTVDWFTNDWRKYWIKQLDLLSKEYWIEVVYIASC